MDRFADSEACEAARLAEDVVRVQQVRERHHARMLRTIASTMAIFLALAIGATLPTAGCAHGVADTYASLSVQERALGAARNALKAASDKMEMDCVDNAGSRADADDCKARLRKKVDAAEKTIVAAQTATVTARDMVQAVGAASKVPSNVMGWVGTAIKLYTDVSDALGQLGVNLGL